MVSLFGGLSAQALRYMATLRKRAKTRHRDTTDYVLGGPRRRMAHWTQWLSAAVVMGDAERALARTDDLRQQAAEEGDHEEDDGVALVVQRVVPRISFYLRV